MKYNRQNKKIAFITEKTLIIGIDVGSQMHYVRAFDWRNYEYSRKPFAFSNDESGFMRFKAWMDEIAERHHKEQVIPDRALLVQSWSIFAGTGYARSACESTSCEKIEGTG